VPATHALADHRRPSRFLRAQLLVGAHQHLLVRTEELVLAGATVVIVVATVAATIRNRPPVVVVTSSFVGTAFGERGWRGDETQYERRRRYSSENTIQHADPLLTVVPADTHTPTARLRTGVARFACRFGRRVHAVA
jgi:hypothetical protein